MIYRKESIIIHEKLNMVFEKAQDIATSLKHVSAYKNQQGDKITHRSIISLWGIPVSYTSETVIKKNESIQHEQINGPLVGLKTEYWFDAVGEGTRVAINHQIDMKIPLIGKWMEGIVYAMVIRSLAKKCLSQLKCRCGG